MSETYTEYRSWDLPVRLFHWINVLCVFCQIAIGLIMLNKSSLGIQGVDASVGLKTVHVIIGYVFLVNLLIRFIWAFIGSPSARWRAFVFKPSDIKPFREYLGAEKSGSVPAYVGHTPPAKLSVTVIYLVLTVMTVTGLVRAGTDIYYPPFGGTVTRYIAAEGVEAESLIPYDKSQVDETRYAEMGAFKGPFGKIHIVGAYLLMILIFIHVASCVVHEVRHEGGLISAMFSGRKLLTEDPVDKELAGQ
jgi:Ni/Fe-hydrogenase 1 B-type cytochrome subunit